jgi:hypothetical protein
VLSLVTILSLLLLTLLVSRSISEWGRFFSDVITLASCIPCTPPPITAVPADAHSWQPTTQSSGTLGLATLDMDIYITFFPLLISLIASLKLMHVLLVAWANTFDCQLMILLMLHYFLFNRSIMMYGLHPLSATLTSSFISMFWMISLIIPGLFHFAKNMMFCLP